jgi:hypothetical protein
LKGSLKLIAEFDFKSLKRKDTLVYPERYLGTSRHSCS